MTVSNLKTVPLACNMPDDADFSPYGRIVQYSHESPANLKSGSVESWLLPFESASPAHIMFNRYHNNDRRFSVMEKHLDVTQCFFPLGNTPFIMVVGVESQGNQPFSVDDVKAFYIRGDQGVLLWRNVWHSLARFAVGSDHIDLAFITDRSTQDEIESSLAGGEAPSRTLFTDFKNTDEIQFLVRDPL
ncbi:ureidoglycolate lyase [Castellaniella sp.]|uniref:ureidoglycolate lyase n=1 Tax=Castellaniella sp. TaxID=1955812 RepID=UPI003C745D79